MERRMKGNFHVRCGSGERLKIISKVYLSTLEILSQATQKKEYYYKSEKGNRLFELDLSQIELSYLATSSEADNKKYQTLETLENKKFNIEWLKYKGIEKSNEIVEKVIKRISEVPK